ncbi:MAG: monofunctional biosynthetic peptidoglycan transglycosylase [Deltaproteobacteria bacterium]|nr:monofunctional biosynthetic peptidoglycan transglycosylase [Deltaproteobacteria bacterium]
MGWLADHLLLRRWRTRTALRLRRRVGCVIAATLLGVVSLSALTTLSLRWIDPPTSAYMLRDQRAARLQGRDDYRLRQYWVDWEYIAPHARVAVVAAEDQRFPWHPGFDLESIAEAVHERVRGERKRGASTISQQVAKNLFLWPGQSFVRKGLEAYFTVLIELFWPKQRVLEVYLNLAQFGDGIFGIEAASIAYYGKSAAALTPREAALLAAVLPNPIRLRADRPSDYVQSRSDWILAQVEMLGGPAYVRALPE